MTTPNANPTGGAPAPKVPPEFMAEFTEKMAAITREEMDKKIEALKAKAASGEINLAQHGRPEDLKLKHQAFYDSYDPLKGKGVAFGQFIKAHLIAAKGGRALADVTKELQAVGKLDEFVGKALLESNFQDGGSTIKPEVMADFIELLRAALVLRELGMGVLPMKNNELIWNRQVAPAQAAYRGELVAILASQLKTGAMKFQARELNVFTGISNNLLADGGPLIDMMVRDDVIAVMALRSDLAGIRGNGANDTPKGLRYLADSGNIFDATVAGADATFQEVMLDLAKMIRKVKGVNGVIKKGGWVITPRVEEYLQALAFQNISAEFGINAFREQLDKGLIRNMPYRTTTQVPDNLGVGANQTEVYLADFAEYFRAENEGVLVESSREATFTDGSGATVNAFQQGVTAIKATAREDYGLRQTKKAAILTACPWGSSLG
jgi:HK97 family phage major capsid protein